MQFDHEKLDVYQLTLEFISWTTTLIAEVKQNRDNHITEACDHLDRASLSVLFNTAEGNGKRRRQIRAKFFDDARGSTTECAACLDALVAKGATTKQRVQDGKHMLVRMVSMLTKLVAKFDNPDCLKDESIPYETTSTVA